ncbi:NAD-dependent epimerase/dehydratase family protein [Actinomadura rupiterrae]|uniref:NAD-dependent epimerase/dehydratase family protein n=1 Tax=Actinomadura rupiterrae TaxID=559627 RepID=UPI003558B49A
MKVLIPGGTGQVGAILDRALTAAGHDVTVLTRRPAGPRQVAWDGRTLGPWADEFDGADAVINLAGRSVSCRYTPANLQDMMDSRVLSTEGSTSRGCTTSTSSGPSCSCWSGTTWTARSTSPRRTRSPSARS